MTDQLANLFTNIGSRLAQAAIENWMKSRRESDAHQVRMMLLENAAIATQSACKILKLKNLNLKDLVEVLGMEYGYGRSVFESLTATKLPFWENGDEMERDIEPIFLKYLTEYLSDSDRNRVAQSDSESSLTTTRQRLDLLVSLHSAGVISDSEFATKRAEILAAI